MRNKNLTTLILALAVFIFILGTAGCKQKKIRMDAVPAPTQIPAPHLEKIIYTNNGNLYWMDIDGSSIEELFPDSNSKWFPAVSSNGFYTAYWVQNKKSYNLWIGDLKKRKAYPVTFDEDTIDGETHNFNFKNSVCFTADSENIVFSRRGEIWMMTRDGFNLVALTDTHNCISPAISKDKKLVYVIKENENTYNLYIKDMEALQPDKLTSLTGKKAGSPSFSPDGKKIAYTVSDGEGTNIFIVDITSKIELGLTTDGKSNSPSFSPDGLKIIYSSSRNDKYLPSIWIMNNNKEEMKPLITSGGQSPVWLYEVLEAPLPTYTPAVTAQSELKQNDIFDVKESSLTQTTSPAIPVLTSALAKNVIYVPKDHNTSGDTEPFNPEELKVKTVQQGDKLLFYPVIHYDSALSNIKPEFRAALDDMAKIIKLNNAPILIEGHTDSDPINTKKFKSNYELSVARAEAVKTYLIQIQGIEASRIKVTGHGETKPLVPNDTNENKYRNRRAEIMVIKVISDTSISAEATVTTVSQPYPVSPAAVPTSAPVKVQTRTKSYKSIGW